MDRDDAPVGHLLTRREALARTVRNAQDGIFNQGGSQILLAVQEDGGGYRSAFNVALQGV